MTLCIAAVCDDGQDSDPKIVLCSDMERETEGIGSSETEDKVGFVRTGWPVLMAGTLTRANELLNVYAGYLSQHDKGINEFNLLDHMRKPAHIQKAKLVDHYLEQAFSFNRAYFYGDGKTKLPEEFVSRQQDMISRIKLDASLLIAGFIAESDYSNGTVNQRPFLCVVDDSKSAFGIEDVTLEYEYEAIGSGAGTALSMLFRREQESTDSLPCTIYNLYEANCMSDKVPGVGRDILNVDVLYSDGKMKTLTEDGYKYLRARFKKFGPKPINAQDIELKPDFLEPYSPERTDPSPPQGS